MKKILSVQFTRKRKRITDYNKRLRLLMSGKPRLVIRQTAHYIIVQIVKFNEKGDAVIVTANSQQLKKHGWSLGTKNIPAAYLTGLIAGKAAVGKDVKEAVLDVGISKPRKAGRVYAALKGVVDAGLQVACSEDVFPSDDRITGSHIPKLLSNASGNQYSRYKRNSVTAESVSQQFSTLKSKVIYND